MLQLVTFHVYGRSLDSLGPPGALPPGVELVVVDRPMATGFLGGRWHPEAERRLGSGQTCAVARHGTDVVGYCWMARTPVRVGEIGNTVVPAPGEVYFYDAFTIPVWRGRGLFFGLLSRLLAQARSRGFDRGLIIVDTRNRASRRVIEKAGFEIVQAVTRLELCGLTKLWFRRRRASSYRVTLVRSSMTVSHEEGERPGA
jgi:GNAT superfamily N-acetyltransferase